MLELLELQDLADAMVLSLNVEARKRLTIGVELASKPELLLVSVITVPFQAQTAHSIHSSLMNLLLDWTVAPLGISFDS